MKALGQLYAGSGQVLERSRLLGILLVLLIVIAVLVLAQMLWQLLGGIADILLLFVLGWILSFVLDPLMDDLSDHPVPDSVLRLVERVSPAQARWLDKLTFSRTAAVLIVYLGLLLVVVISVALLLPPTAAQLTQLAGQLPDTVARAPQAGLWAQQQLESFGIRVDILDEVRSGTAALQGAMTLVVQNALGIFAGLLSLLANLFLVIILSFYFSLDGTRVRQKLLQLVPESFQREANYFSHSVNRTFGGFIRGQLIQALLQGVGTAVMMTLLGLNFVLAASLFAALFMLIPLVGPALALIPPIIVVLFQAPELTLWLLIALFLFQFIIVNVLMPRVFSKSLGLHPLLVFAAILIGIKVGGFWGAFLGIPVAGVIWAMFEYFVEKYQRSGSESEVGEKVMG